MKWFDYVRPRTLQEAVQAFADSGERGRAIAGGTDLLVQMRIKRRQPDLVVDVKKVPELTRISFDAEKGLTLGAAVPCHRIYNTPEVVANYPGLVDSASLIGGTQIQGRASMGGNLCNAAPSADGVPSLIALGATCRIAGQKGERTVPVEQFCTAPGQTVLAPGEMLVSLHVPAPAPHSGSRYLRFIPRNEMDIAVVGVGVSVVLDPSGTTFRSARIALASVAPTPLFVPEAGAALEGQPVSDRAIDRAAAIARDAARPISDMRGTVDYRRHLCAILTRRALQVAVQRAKEARSNA